MFTPLKTLMITLTLAGCAAQSEGTATGGRVDTSDAFLVDEGGVVATPETYPTLETSRQLLINQSKVGVNSLLHKRVLTPTDNQPVVRMNRDTYYSLATVDVSKGATLTLPEIPAGKYMSLQPVTEDHRIQAMSYGPGSYELTTHTGTHLSLVIRLDSTFSPEEASRIQDQMKLEANSSEPFTAAPVNEESFIAVENALKAQMPALAEREGIYALRGMFTDVRDDSNEYYTDDKYQIGAAIGWGGAQWIDNVYEISGNYTVDQAYQMTFDDPENGAFWSVTVYDKNGFMFNDLASLNSHTATANSDGTFTVSFGCGADAPNNIETANPTGMFNLGIRHYRPSVKVREGGYRLLPFVKPVGASR